MNFKGQRRFKNEKKPLDLQADVGRKRTAEAAPQQTRKDPLLQRRKDAETRGE